MASLTEKQHIWELGKKMTMITLSEKSAVGEGWRRENGSNWIAVYPSGLLPFPLGALKSLSFLFDLKFDREIARMQHSLSALQKRLHRDFAIFSKFTFWNCWSGQMTPHLLDGYEMKNPEQDMNQMITWPDCVYNKFGVAEKLKKCFPFFKSSTLKWSWSSGFSVPSPC